MPLSDGSPRTLLLGANQAVSLTVTNTTAETAWDFSILIPAGTLRPGVAIKVSQIGVYQSGLSQSITPRVRLGPAATNMTNRAILAATAGAVSGLLNAAADTPWAADTFHVFQPDNTFLSGGKLFFSTSATAALAALVATRTKSPVIDPTVDNVLTASAQWSAASASNQIACTVFTAELVR